MHIQGARSRVDSDRIPGVGPVAYPQPKRKPSRHYHGGVYGSESHRQHNS